MTPKLLNSIKSAFAAANISDDNFNPADLFKGLTPHDDVSDLRGWAKTRGMPVSKFRAAYKTWRTEQELGQRPETVKQFVELYAAWQGITARYNSRLDSPKVSAADLERNVADLTTALRLYRSDYNLGYKNDEIDAALGAWLRDQRNARRAAVWNAIYRDDPPNADNEWQRAVAAIVDTRRTSARYAVAALKSVMWQVKRKLVGDKVHHHLMPVIFGGQGSGKSEFVRRLAAPMSDLLTAVNFRTITDTKNMQLWTFPLVFCDEMDQASRADVDSIKNAITKEENTDRGHNSHNMITVGNGATFIGCCNSTLGERINDNTGMRRFAPIASREEPTPANIAAGLPVSDWAAINDADFGLLWQSVDHRAEHPMILDPDAFAEWRALADAERAQDGVETWLKQLTPGGTLSADGVFKGSDLYERYKQFCDDMGYKACALNKLGMAMRNYVTKDWYPFKEPRQLKGVTVHEFKPGALPSDAHIQFKARVKENARRFSVIT